MLVFDIESDGLLDTITKVHCINAIDSETGKQLRFTDNKFYRDLENRETSIKCPRDGNIAAGLQLLSTAKCIAGQNIIGYDIPALKLVYPDWTYSGTVRDSRIESKLLYPDLMDRDFAALRKGKLPQEFKEKGLCGTHKLESWGVRIGKELKEDFNPEHYGHTWKSMPFTQDFDDYCMQDVVANLEIFNHFDGKPFACPAAMELENKIRVLITDQEENGVHFNEKKANELLAVLQPRRAELEAECQEVFTPWYKADGKFAHHAKTGLKGKGLWWAKKSMKRFIEHPEGGVVRRVRKRVDGETTTVVQRGWWNPVEADVPHTKIIRVVFNPASRDHIADRFRRIYEWSPAELTDTGKAKVDETILEALPYPEAKKLAEFFTVDKRLGQLATGKNAWFKSLTDDGKIHGSVDTLGAVTNRMSHSKPNLAQVPANYAPYGEECRGLFGPRPGWKMVGMDADGLEARCLGHYLALHDNGKYIHMLLEGNKAEGTDNHSMNQKAAEFNSRDNAKTLLYALLYGAGDFKLGTIVVDDMTDERKAKFYAAFPIGKKRNAAIVRLGKKAKAKLIAGIEGMGVLTKSVKKKAKTKWMRAIDGRRIRVRSQHAALNTLLQSAGAVIMKKALVIAHEELCEKFTYKEDFAYLLNIHDEVQLECRPELAEEIGKTLADGVRKAGEELGFRCPLVGNYDIGDNWSETH